MGFKSNASSCCGNVGTLAVSMSESSCRKSCDGGETKDRGVNTVPPAPRGTMRTVDKEGWCTRFNGGGRVEWAVLLVGFQPRLLTVCWNTQHAQHQESKR